MGSGDGSANSRQRGRMMARPSRRGGQLEHLFRAWGFGLPTAEPGVVPGPLALAARGAQLCSQPTLSQLDWDACGLPSSRSSLTAT